MNCPNSEVRIRTVGPPPRPDSDANNTLWAGQNGRETQRSGARRSRARRSGMQRNSSLRNIFWRRAHMSSLSGGARRATGARRKEAGQLEQHLLIQSITNGLALATGEKDGWLLRKPAGDRTVAHMSGGARAHVEKEPSAKRSPVQSTTVQPATSPACGTLLGGRDCAEACHRGLSPSHPKGLPSLALRTT